MIVPIVKKRVNICIVSPRNPCMVGASDISCDEVPFNLNVWQKCAFMQAGQTII